MAILIITHGNRTIRRELDDKHTVVGRDPGCDLFFADKRLSRQHARFEATEDGVRLVDLGSRNGTWVNQTRIKEVTLGPDDSIRIGSLTISIEVAEPVAASPPVRETAPSELPTTAKLPEETDEPLPLELVDDGGKAESALPAPEREGTVMASKDEAVVGELVPPTVPLPRPAIPVENEPAKDEAGTVMLEASQVEASDENEAGTVMLSKGEEAATEEPPVPPTAPLPRPAIPVENEPAKDEAGTVMLPASQVEASDENEAGTVMLSKGEGAAEPPTTPIPRPARPVSTTDDDEGTVVLSEPKPPTPDAGEKTVLLSRDEPAPSDTATRAISAQLPPHESVAPKTAMLPQDLLSQTVQQQSPGDSELRPPSPPVSGVGQAEVAKPGDGIKDRIASLSWSLKLVLLAIGLGFTVYFVVALPLVSTLGSQLREESLRRGRTLLNLLAATNAAPVGQEKVRELSVEIAAREERVKEAYIINFDGNVLAPADQSDKTMETISGIDVSTKDIRTFYLGRRSGRDYVMVQPLVYQGSRVGVAVLVYEAAAGAGGWTIAILFLGLVAMFAAVGVMVVLGKKMTLSPLASIRDDVEAVIKGDSEYLPQEQAFDELSDLAESINRMIDRAPGLRASAAAKPSPPADWPAPEPRIASAPPVAPPAATGPAPQPPAIEPSPEMMTPAPVPSEIPAPSASHSMADGAGARFWVDESFVVIRAEESVYELVGAAPGEMEGKHLIEAVKEQRVLEVVLDTINSLQSGSSAQGQADLESGSIRVQAMREESSVVVSLDKL